MIYLEEKTILKGFGKPKELLERAKNQEGNSKACSRTCSAIMPLPSALQMPIGIL